MRRTTFSINRKGNLLGKRSGQMRRAFCLFRLPLAVASAARAFSVGELSVKDRIILERKRRQMEMSAPGAPQRSAVTDEDGEIDDEKLAREAGILPPLVVDVEELRAKKEAVINMIQRQRERRLARREQWEDWHAGQKEKGSAISLYRKAKKAEGYRRFAANTTGRRFVSLAYCSPDGRNTNNDADPVLYEIAFKRASRFCVL